MSVEACLFCHRGSDAVPLLTLEYRGATFEEILEGYPDLEREDIEQALEYAAWLTQEQVFAF